MTRAIQTALYIFEDRAPIEIIDGPRELLSHSCDAGRSRNQLALAFPDLSFDYLDDVCWHQGPGNSDGIPVEPKPVFQARVKRFARTLRQIRHWPVAIVAYGDTLVELPGYQMKNCEVRCYFE